MGSFWTVVLVLWVSLAGGLSMAVDENSLATGSLWSPHTTQSKRHATHFQACGLRLVEAVRLFCRGRMYSGYSRRSDPTMIGSIHLDEVQDINESGNVLDLGSAPASSQFNPMESFWSKDVDNTFNDVELLWPHSSKSLALKVLTEGKAHQLVRRSISDECCKKPCAITEMTKYCEKGGRGKRMTV